jgi:tetratricopeptide (TPR) repeat protein
MRSRNKLSLLLILIMVWSAAELCAAQSLGMTGPSTAVYTTDLYKFCSDHDGNPQYGRCYFGDGSYCDLWDFYRGICTSKTMVEQSLWEAGISQFLYGDYGYDAMAPYSSAGAARGVRVGSGGTITQPYPASRLSHMIQTSPSSQSTQSWSGNSASSWLSKANALYNQGQYEKALDAYNTTIGMDPTLAEAWYGKGNALYKLGRFDEAAAIFNAAIYTNWMASRSAVTRA